MKGTWRKGDNNKIIKGIDVVDGRTFEARKHNLPQQGSAQDAVAVAVEDLQIYYQLFLYLETYILTYVLLIP